jgi:iron complex outermembrane receptor protein
MSRRNTILFTTALTGALIGFAGTAQAQDQTPTATTAALNGDDIVVTGIRRSITDAIERKRAADSIVDVISARTSASCPTATSPIRWRACPA